MSERQELEEELHRLKAMRYAASVSASDATRYWHSLNSEVLRLSAEIRDLGGRDG